ncbi:hypothetical protein PENSPDRAFT_755986 [Peniophora sp. CONT]|nr:hypothetical protein PENSPDRAFT_755986 [Peniophora sp. CONT]
MGLTLRWLATMLLTTTFIAAAIVIWAAYTIVSRTSVWIAVSILTARRHSFITPIPPEIHLVEDRCCPSIPGDLAPPVQPDARAHDVDSEPPVPPPYTPRADGDNIQLIPPRSAEYGDRVAFLARLRRTNGADPHREHRPSSNTHDTNQQRATAPASPPSPFRSTSTRRSICTPITSLKLAEKTVVDESSPRRGNRLRAFLRKGGRVKGLLHSRKVLSHGYTNA